MAMSRKSLNQLYFACILFNFLLSFVKCKELVLNGDWEFFVANKTKVFKGTVPGSVQSHLFNTNEIESPLFGDNCIKQQWIAHQNWVYQRSFEVSENDLKASSKQILIFEGIDTVSTVHLNKIKILETNNQFLEYSVDVSKFLKKENILQVKFQSPVHYAKEQAHAYYKLNGHELPPACPPAVIHGNCHVNFIRKAQYSFGWDWGPSIPTVGIWKPVRLLFVETAKLKTVSWTTSRENDDWLVTGILTFLHSSKTSAEPECSLEIEGLPTKLSWSGFSEAVGSETSRSFNVTASADNVKLWWPAGEGAQQLYNMTVKCGTNVLTEEIGFHHIELIEDLVDPKYPAKGRNFYFKINDRPIFLKGSNWIPSSMFLGEDHEERVEFLLDSALEVGMNSLRVWGGGVYETEHFYRYANRKGILLWQDLMFACALYPPSTDFVNIVKNELRQQVSRLRKHPSILLFAGDNELEVAIRTHWWSVTNFTESDQVTDYLLFRNAVFDEMASLDPSRPFILSSPGNGPKEARSDNISSNPGDPRYGDIHFYNEFINLWQDAAYQTPRCATEYGVQSMPFRKTMLRYINESDWIYSSSILSHRQHHRAGVVTNLITVFSHFPILLECGSSLSDLPSCPYVNSRRFMDRYAFFSQAHQAIAYKVQTEHYRRYRNRLTPDGQGNTMCALYWQLNDVWAAPTWSSIDVDLNWKMVHYEARRFFAPVMVSLYSTSTNDLGVTVINDTPLDVTSLQLQIRQLVWENGFVPVFEEEITVDAPALTAKEIKLFGNLNDYDSDYVYTARLINEESGMVGPESVLMADKFFEVDFDSFGDLTVSNFSTIDEKTYSITIQSTAISPFTWITVVKDYLGWFSDNGFTMTEPMKEVKLHLRKPLKLRKEDIIVCNLKNCGL